MLGNNLLPTGFTYGPDRFCDPNAAIYLNGSQLLICNKTNGLNNRQYAITAWIKTSTNFPFPQGTIVNIGSDPGQDNGQRLYLNSSGSISASTGVNNSLSFTPAPASILPDQWTFVAIVRGLSTDSLYINGVLRTAYTFPEILPKTYYSSQDSPPLYVGGDPGGTNFFEGYLDDLHIYNEPLSASTVLAIYGFGSSNLIQFDPGEICKNKPTTFSVDGTNAQSITWNFGDGMATTTLSQDYSITHVFAESGNYVVTAFLKTSCTIIPPPKSVLVYISPCPPPCKNPTKITLLDSCLELPLNFLINADNSTKEVLWDFGDNMKSNVNSPPFTGIHQYANPGIYKITATTKDTCNGGVALLYSNLSVISCLPQPIPQIPSAFTPNGDGMNDTWSIPELINFPKCSLQIFDRWGGLVFDSPKGYQKVFDGYFKSRRLPMGTYYYIIHLKEGIRPLTGSVTILY